MLSLVETVSPVLKTTFTYVGMFVLAYIIFLVYKLLLKPYLVYRRYQGVKNVYTSGFNPLIGDVKDAIKDIKEGRAHYTNRIRDAPKLKDYDMRLRYEGTDPVMLLLSNPAIEEFVKLQPNKIDRADIGKGIYKAGQHTFLFKPSSANIVNRRKLMISELALNRSSTFVPVIVNSTLEILDQITDGKVHEFVGFSNILTFDVFTTILFGEDQKGMINKMYPYLKSDGTTEQICLRDLMVQSFKDHYSQLFHPLTSMMRPLSDYNLCNPYIRDKKNMATYLSATKEMFKNAKDPNTISRRILSNPDFSEFEKFNDIIAFIMAGAETSSHGIASTLWLLKKYPHTLQKLRKELADNGITKEYIKSGKFTMDDLSDLDYLNYCVKESFRFDGPAPEAFVYTPSQDVQIRGVTIPKGMLIRTEIHSTHYNENYWHKPLEFAPERFDIESEFFAEAKKLGKAPAAHSRRTFGIGMRSCPGMSFATLEIKVSVAVFAVMTDWSIDEELKNKEGATFGIGSEVPCKMRFTNNTL